ncbi:MAG: hypothetical protein JHC57_12905 [Sphingopyxis sp.]|uniref:hypothetical protein n=1 Tax=Sphingopyxis sp. TaxID=1908224 RepID=UPI001A1D98DF|nr:hypothetical protein [Sphingopyxis sp.]MBJ7500643.1 hypothetical protein [Sphingopyxis sp.]
MRSWEAICGAMALLAAGSAHAQTAYPGPAAGDPPFVAPKRYYLPMGTPLKLQTTAPLSTKDSKPGDRVRLAVVEDVSFRGTVVVPVGTPVIGEVSRAQRNGHVGRKGKLEVRLISIEMPDGPVRLSGNVYDEGKSQTALSVGTMLLVSALGGFLIHGTSASIPAQTPVTAYIAEPLRFAWRPEKQALMALLPRPEASAPGQNIAASESLD